LGIADFSEPKFGAGFGNCEIPATFVAMPETAVYKYYGSIFRQNNIGFSGEGFYIQPVSKAVGKQKLPHEHFRFGVFPLNAAHVVGAGSSVVYIGHEYN